jgi:8-oxo-dGTP diphosphatase
MTHVVAALIFQGDRFMICQRPPHKKRGLLWEFVGGKVEPGETKEEALIRECREELDITLEVGPLFMEVDHEYPDLHVCLSVFFARIAEGDIVLKEHNDLKWITVSEIPNYDFCPADGPILEALQEREKGCKL